MKSRRALSAVVSLGLLVVVSVLSVVSFSNWFDFYQGGVFSDVENKGEVIEKAARVDGPIGDSLYIRTSNSINLSVFQITDGSGEVVCSYEETDKSDIDGLVGYWSFDEGKGDIAYDYSFSKNNGTLVCDGNLCLKPTWSRESKIGGAMRFFASGDNKSCVRASSINVPLVVGERITLSMWLKSGTLNDTNLNTLIRNGNQADANYHIYISNYGNNEKIGLELYNQSDFVRYNSNYSLPKKQWFYLTLEYSQGEWYKIYINGNYVENVTINYLSVESTSSFNIGGHLGAIGQYYNGLIDELKVYNRSLSNNEIKNLYYFNRLKMDLDPGINEISLSGCNLIEGEEYFVYGSGGGELFEREFIAK